MKSVFPRFVVLSAAFILIVVQVAFVQEKTPVKVKSSEVVTGVVIVHVLKEAKSLDLQCNEGAMNCSKLASGNYLMYVLPENYGMYDCKNVEMYRGDADKPDDATKVGAYCLVVSPSAK